MTRQHFEAIAKAVASVHYIYGDDMAQAAPNGEYLSKDALVLALANALQPFNPRFKVNTFTDACRS